MLKQFLPTHAATIKDIAHDPRLSCEFKQLLRLKVRAQGFSFLPHHKSNSVMAGRRQSQFRGRGLNFEELRHYQQGDDIRNLDWRVTLRTGKPHVRSYSEEKDRKVCLCVDQSPNMYFSSVEVMKSVVAAEIAALSAWKILADGDRVGAMLFGQGPIQSFTPQRSANQVMRMLRKLSICSQELRTNIEQFGSQKNQLEPLLNHLIRSQTRNNIIIIISDFLDLDTHSSDLIKRLRYHNDVLCVMVSDPMEEKLGIKEQFVASDGELQLQIEPKQTQLISDYGQVYQERQVALKALLDAQQLPFIKLGTDSGHMAAFIRSFSGEKP